MKTDKKIKLSIVMGIFAAIFWTIADILLLGFVTQTEKYQPFIDLLPKNISSDFAILMLEAGSERLFYGVYFATFSVFLYLLSTYAIYKLLPRKRINTIAVLALFIGYATSPLGHAGFAYIGLLSKNMQAMNPEIILSQLVLLEQFEHLLYVHWIVSVSFSALGFIIILIQTLTKQFATRWGALFNPFLVAILIGSTASLFSNSLIAAMFSGASLNISQLLFFVYLYFIQNNRFTSLGEKP